MVKSAEFIFRMAQLQWLDCQTDDGDAVPCPSRAVCAGCCVTRNLTRCPWCNQRVCDSCAVSCPLGAQKGVAYMCDHGRTSSVLVATDWHGARLFDSTLGFPGEGPPQNKQKSSKTGDLASRVQLVTELRYEQRYVALGTWAGEQGFPSFESLVRQEAWQTVDAVLTAYVQGLHANCAPISHGSYTLAAFQYRWPEVVGKIPWCWLAQRQWSRLQPPNIRCPMPLRVLLALASTAWVLAQPRMAVGFLISFLGLLRPGEWASLRRQHIVLPMDLSGMEATMTIAITQSKTSTRGPRIQSVLIADPLVVRLTQAVVGADLPSAPLVRGGLRHVVQAFENIRRHLQLHHSAFTLSTMRGGGAIHHLQSCQSIAYLQWLGRWASEKS
eukprot:2790882-Amphidinium_carterae.1